MLPVSNHAVTYVTVKAITRQIKDLTNERVRVSFNYLHLSYDRFGIMVFELSVLLMDSLGSTGYNYIFKS
jgi:hypothetical protein